MTEVTRSSIADGARQHLRDFPKFFQVTPAIVGRTYRLPHQNVIPDRLLVATGSGSTLTTITGYDLDEREGVLRLPSVPTGTLMIEGYYYEWVSQSDLEFFSAIAMNEFCTSGEPPLSAQSGAVTDIVSMSAVVEALWSLLLEFSRDIDVSTPEAVHVPASQRFRMLESLLAQWITRYKEKATLLNVGLHKIEVYTVRRISMSTGRLVPLYRMKEFGDTEPLERLWPGVPTGLSPADQQPEKLRDVVYVEEVPPNNGTAWSTETYGV